MNIKCFHCQQTPEILILLQPQGKALKHICLKCFTTRHPQTSRETLEALLDAEQALEKHNVESLKKMGSRYYQGGIYGETIY